MATSTPFSNSEASSDMFRQSEMNLTNITDMIRARDVALSLQSSSVTPQIKRAFEIRQKSWYDWCTKRVFDDGSLVHEDKLILWIDDVVLKHGGVDKLSRKRKAIGKQEKGKDKVRRIEAGSQGILPQEIMETVATRPDPEPEGVELSSDPGWELIEGWIAAILNLYHKQASMGENSYPHPHGIALESKTLNLRRIGPPAKRKLDPTDRVPAPPLFSSPQFKEFATVLLGGELLAESSIDTQICEALPRITEKLRQSQNHAVDQQIPASVATMQLQLEDLLNGRRPVYLSTKPLSSPVSAIITAFPDAASTNSPVLVSAATRAAHPPAASTIPRPRGRPRRNTNPSTAELQVPAATLTAPSFAENSPDIAAPVPSNSDYTYRMSPQVKTIPDLWQEWTVGFGGGPSVESLNTRFGCKWRKSVAHRQWYSRRRRLIRVIQDRISAGGAPAAVIEELEQARLRMGKGLNAFIRHVTTPELGTGDDVE